MKKSNYLLLILMLFGFGNLHAQITAIPDSTFEQWLINNNIDTDGLLNHQVATVDISGITELNLYYVNIQDFTGLQDFKALTSLTTGYAPATSMDLSALTELKTLSLYGNSLSVIDLSHNLALTNINLGNAYKLKTLDISANTAITTLEISGTKISTLDFSNNSALTSVILNYNSSLVNLNMSNGNNANITNFSAQNCSLLSCIIVDNISVTNNTKTVMTMFPMPGGMPGMPGIPMMIPVTTPIWQKDAQANYSETDCGVYTAIPDAGFQYYLTQNGIIVSDKKVLTSDISGITTIDLTGDYNAIANFTGIQDFAALTNFKYNRGGRGVFSSIDLSQNTNLTFLEIKGNDNLTTIDLSKNTQLQELNISDGALTRLDISKNPLITKLFCSGNSNLSALNLKGRADQAAFEAGSTFNSNPKLSCIEVDDIDYATANWLNKDTSATYYSTGCPTTSIPDPKFELALINNQLDDVIDGKVFTGNIVNAKELYLSGYGISDLTGIEAFVSLNMLEAPDNNLTNIDVSKNILLTELYLSDNKLENVDVSKNLALTNFDIQRNQVKFIDVSKNLALNSLFVRNNQLKAIDVSKNIELQYLFCKDNKITKIDISQNVALIQLEVNNNSLVNVNLKGNTNNIDYLELSNNPLLSCIEVDDIDFAENGSHSRWFKDNFASYSITPCNAYTVIPDAAFEQSLIDKSIDSGVVNGKVLTSALSAVTNLSISNTNISDFSGLEDFTELNTLELHGNDNLTNVDFSKNTKLQYLYVDGNKLANLDVTKNVELIDLSFKNNAIKAIDVSKNAALEFLNCSENLLTILDVSNNPELKNLNCYSNQLVTLDLSQNTQLTNINCQNNNLKSVNLKNGNNTNLETAIVTRSAKNNAVMYPIGVFGFQANDPELVVLVDNKVYSDDNWMSYKDASAVYLENISLGTGDNNFETLSIAPNPTSGELYINNIALDKVIVITLLGNVVKTINFKDENTSNVVDLSDLTAGLYLVKLSSNGSEKTVKVLKK